MDDATTIVDGTIGEVFLGDVVDVSRALDHDLLGRRAMATSARGITPWGPWGRADRDRRAGGLPWAVFPVPRSALGVQDGGRKVYFPFVAVVTDNVFWFSLDLEKAL